MILFSKVLKTSFASASPKVYFNAKNILANVFRFIFYSFLFGEKLKNRLIYAFLFIMCSHPVYAGGYIAADAHMEIEELTPETAIIFSIYMLPLMFYFLLKTFNNKFINKIEDKFLFIWLVVVPAIIFIVTIVTAIFKKL